MKGGVRGKYAKRFREGTNIVLIDPDMVEPCPTVAAVNEALRGVLNTARGSRGGGGLNKNQDAAADELRNARGQEARAFPRGSRLSAGR